MVTIEKLRQIYSAGQLEPFIRYIRFPHYKNLEPNTKLNFDFPLTALVGPNGTNKSSVLRALFGAPKDNNLGNFWFSTKVDPIAETGDRPRFIYGYFNSDAKQVVEIIKTRIHKEEKPDYWEPSRPLVKDGMQPLSPLPEGVDEAPGRKRTRWLNIEKNVVYIDFRSEISAFDKYFYHGELYQTLKIRTKQDYMRRRAGWLKNAIEQNLQTHKMRNNEYIIKNNILSKDERDEISKILNRDYISIRHIHHRFFGLEGHSVILQHRDLTYSEAFAGSGEFAAVMLVVKVWNAEERSLILLDEPEVSLHPGAQEALVAFLLQQIKRKKHQVVISTHSPRIIAGLPADAIKTFHLDRRTGKAIIEPAVIPEEAFFYLGEPVPGRIRIIVEDRLGAEVVRKAIRPLGEAVASAFDIVHFPGGAQTLATRYFPIFAMEGSRDTLVLLDGDQRPLTPLPMSHSIPAADDEKLQSMINAFAGGEVQLLVDGGAKGADQTQSTVARRQYIQWVHDHVQYLPGSNPEEFVWNNMVHDDHSLEVTSTVHKLRFRELTARELGLAEFENPRGDDIFHSQKRRLATIPSDHPDLTNLGAALREFANARTPHLASGASS